MNDFLYCLEYATKHYMGYSDMVTGYNKHNYRKTQCVFFSHFWLSRRLSFEERNFFITSNHLIVRECVCCKMRQPSKRRRCIQSSEIAQHFLTLIEVTRQYQATLVQLRVVLMVCQGYRILNLTAKQPVVLNPAVQFRPLPLTKKKVLIFGQGNRLDRQ